MGSRLRPILMFTGNYDADSSLNRIGVKNTFSLMKQAFFTSNGLNLQEKDSCIIEDMPYTKAYDKLQEYVEHLANDDVVFFYFCGHGFPDYKNNTVILATTDTTRRNKDKIGIKHIDLIELLKNYGISKYIIVFDCCQAGFLCKMGEEPIDESFDIGKIDKDIQSAVYISSTLRDEETVQKEIAGKFYIPFSYYFATYILNRPKTVDSEFSIHEIFEAVDKELKNDSEYRATCISQQKGELWDEKIFEIYSQSKSIDVSSGFLFGSFFSSVELKVLLVKTAIKHPISKYDDFGVPLGLYVLKGHLSTSGLSLKVDIYDERLELRKCEGNKNAKKGVLDKFKTIVKRYDVIGVSMCTAEVFPAMEKFQIAKEEDKITFCGGIFTSSNEKYLLESGLVDYVIPGVGTKPTTSLLARLAIDKIQNTLGKNNINIDGVASKNNMNRFGGVWVPTTLPVMRRAMWIEILKEYGPYLKDEKTGKARMDVYTARGCARNCTFCSVQKESRQIQLQKPLDCVIDEIKYLQSQGIEYFSIKDEDLLSDEKRLFDILKAVKKEGVLFKIRARYDEMSRLNTPLERLRELGVDEIQYGIESPDVYLSRNVKKGFSRQPIETELIDFIRKHAEYGITANCSFILGIEGEDEKYYDDLMEFITKIYDDKSKPKIYINFLTPHPVNSSFPTQNYNLATNNLNLFTHKYPVCYAKGSDFGIRKKMLETYDKIVLYTDSKSYNPLVSDMPDNLRRSFTNGKSKIKSASIPQYTGKEV